VATVSLTQSLAISRVTKTCAAIAMPPPSLMAAREADQDGAVAVDPIDFTKCSPASILEDYLQSLFS
jgi:hypothetical protein